MQVSVFLIRFILFLKKNIMFINLNQTLINTDSPLIMGILNITPDSFFDGGKYKETEQALRQTQKMLREGADIIDVGAYSTRPGASVISEKEEWQRLEPILKCLRNELPDIIISLDTFRSEIAEKAVEQYNVALINDISAGDADKNMFKTVADLQVPYIAMHKQGNPQNMQDNPHYKNVVKDIIRYFAQKIEQAHLIGINDFIIDPGFGFGKTLKHNYTILKNLDDFKILKKQILVGLSRKSMIYKPLQTNPTDALNGTSALNMLALQKGANILRVHDVKEAVQIRTLHKLVSNPKNVSA